MFSKFGGEFEIDQIPDHKSKHPLFLFFSAWKLGLFHCFLITKKTKNEQKLGYYLVCSEYSFNTWNLLSSQYCRLGVPLISIQLQEGRCYQYNYLPALHQYNRF